MSRTLKSIALGLSILSFAACSEQASDASQTKGAKPQAPKPAPAETVKLPADLFSATAPTDAKPLREVRASSKTGDTIAVTGYIGGREKPFTEGRALFQLVDEVNAPICVDHDGAVWDACCTPSATIAENSATIQVVDESGQTLKIGLDGQGGLAPGSVVTVMGKVRELNESIMIVDASAIHAHKSN